jgi:hypothetical protein
MRLARPGAPWASACFAVALFVLVWFDGRSRMPVEDTEAHHRRVRDLAATSLASCVGDWLGKDVDSPPSVVALLRPNVLVTRAYTNLRTGETATLLFVHCSDARDLIGHYPPVCYPAHGQETKSSEARDWTVAGVTITGMRYHFDGREGPFGREMVVDNFMVLPNGRYGRDMDMATRVAWDRRLRHFGAAEVQVVTNGEMTDARRDEVFRTLLEPALPLFESVGAEVHGD